jgi:hypothetical protein
MRLGITMAILTAFCGAAGAGPYIFADDLSGDWTGLSICEIHGIGSYIDDGTLHFQIRTDVPQGGFHGSDGRAYTHFSPGDLFVAVGTDDPFDPAIGGPGVAMHGIAVTSHGNVVQQAYAGENWDDVVEGRLYTDAVFATGTYENYQYARAVRGLPFAPDDGDGDNRTNSYWSLIKTGTEVADASAIRYDTAPPADPWDYTVTGWVDMAAIGLGPGMKYTLFHSIECGNDGAGHSGDVPEGGGPPPIPEPATAGLTLLGLLVAFRRRRRSR